MSEPRNTCTPMPMAMPAAMRTDCTGLLRKKRVAMPKLSTGQLPSSSGSSVKVDDLLRQPSRPCRNAGPPTQMSIPERLLQQVHCRRSAKRWKCVDELITIASTLRLRAASAISATACRPQEVRRPAGHVETVGHHAQPQVVPFFRRAGQQHRATARRTAAFRLEHARVDELHNRAHGGAGQVLFPDGRRPRCQASPVSTGARSTSRYSTAMEISPEDTASTAARTAVSRSYSERSRARRSYNSADV